MGVRAGNVMEVIEKRFIIDRDGEDTKKSKRKNEVFKYFKHYIFPSSFMVERTLATETTRSAGSKGF